MKKWQIALVIALLAGSGIGYAYRGQVRDALDEWNKPKLPSAARFNPNAAGSGQIAGEQNSPVEGGVATSEHYVLVSSPTSAPKSADPFEDNGPLPDEANLDVPFTSQAPYGDWALPYQEACEEASAIMVDAYYRNITGKIPPEQAKKAIDAVVEFENKTFGYYKDTDAADTAKFIKEYFKYQSVVVKPLTSPEEIKRAVANGFPVIVPAAGKLLPNPNFRNGGPLYHMLVVKGYTRDKFITNDPGTRKGADFTYTYSALMNAAHDWNKGDVMSGKPMMIVIVPNPT